MKPIIVAMIATLPLQPEQVARRLPEATRPEFDLVVVEGTSYASLIPFLGTERIEGGLLLIDHNNAHAQDDIPRVAFQVDPQTDYTVRAFVHWWLDDVRHTDNITIELPVTVELRTDWLVYNALRAQRELVAHIDLEDVPDDQLADAVRRMNARLDNEGDDG